MLLVESFTEARAAVLLNAAKCDHEQKAKPARRLASDLLAESKTSGSLPHRAEERQAKTAEHGK